MTIAASTTRVSFACDGTTTVFPVNIQAYLATDFTVILTAPSSAGGGETTLVLNSAYSMASSGTLAPPWWTLTTLGGTPYATGYSLQVILEPAQTQVTQYVQGQAFPSAAVQQNFDRLTQMVIRLQDQINRTVIAPDGDVSPTMVLPSAAARANLSPYFNSAGNLAVGVTPSTTVTQAIIGVLLYPQTAAEIAAGVTPVNYAYPTLIVNRYANNTTPGTTDMTAAFQAANSVANAAGGGQCIALGQTYKVSGTVAVSANVWFQGQGDATVITTSSATADVFQLAGTGARVTDMLIQSSVTRTGGYYVNANSAGTYMRCERVDMINFYNGFGHTGAGGAAHLIFEDSFMTTNVAGGIGVYVNTTAPSVDVVFSRVTVGGPSAISQLAAGFEINEGGDITLDHCLSTWGGTGLLVQPGNGQTVQLLLVNDCEFDSSSGHNVSLNPLGTGSIQAALFENTWATASSGGCGFALCPSGQGTILRSVFADCIGSNNTTGEGFLISFSGATDTEVNFGTFAGNSVGMYVASGVTKFKFNQNICRATGQWGNNSSYAIALLGSNDLFTITDNDFNQGNASNFNITVPVGGVAGQSWFIKNNQGILTQNGGQATLTAAGTTTTVTHGLPGFGASSATPRLQDIYLTQNSSLGTAAQAWVSAVGSTTFTITTNANPGAGVNVGWNAKLWGN